LLDMIPPAALLLLHACVIATLGRKLAHLPHAGAAAICAVAPAVYGLGTLLYLVLGEWVPGAMIASVGTLSVPLALVCAILDRRWPRALAGVFGAVTWGAIWSPRQLIWTSSATSGRLLLLYIVVVVTVSFIALSRGAQRGIERRVFAATLPFFLAAVLWLLLRIEGSRLAVFSTIVLVAGECMLLLLVGHSVREEAPTTTKSLAIQAALLAIGALLCLVFAMNLGLFPKATAPLAVAVVVATGLSVAYGALRPSLDLLLRSALYPEAQDSAARLAALRAELERTRARLREAEDLSLVGQLAVDVAHEIKNPLGPIRGYAKIIERELEERGPMPEVVARGIEVIRQEVEAIDQRARGLLELGRPPSPRLEEVEWRRVAQDAIDLVAAACPESVKIAWRAEPAPERGRTDPLLLRSAVGNVLANAVQALEARGGPGRIELELAREGDALFLLVDDDGPGLPEADPERLFQRFASRRPGGHGLGLVIARGSLRALGGDLVLEPRAGGGARARFRLSPSGEPATKEVVTP
jgi:signal transduction histidine kinase